MTPKKPGPKPRLKRPSMIRFALEGADRRAVDAYADERGITRSEALRQLVRLGLIVSSSREG